MRYWDWAVEVHGREGVDALLTGLQDTHGQCVSYLLWAAWAAAERRPVEEALLRTAADVAHRWEAVATSPLRHARRELKAAFPPIDDGARLGLREQVRGAEFAAERLLMETLEAVTPAPADAPRDLVGALRRAVAAWPNPAPAGALEDLAARLGGG